VRTVALPDRLSFRLPDFTRMSWVSDSARGVWEPRIRRVTQAWFAAEWATVAAGHRRCAVIPTSPEGLPELTDRWLEHDLSALPLELQGTGATYASASTPAVLGQPFTFRVVVGRVADLRAFKRAWDGNDHAIIGALLGYPGCCYDFFRRVWIEDGLVDTTWPMATSTTGAAPGVREVQVTGPFEANILWRWMGVRAVAHLPCRFDCGATQSVARSFREVARRAGHEDEMTWLEEILRWPVEWSALHGIAEVLTPVLKVTTRTDATAGRYTVRREGDRYPSEGAQGVRFPYRRPFPPRRRPGGDGDARPADAALDNGFATAVEMDRAHEPIVALARETLAGAAGLVLDLGCGDGALLEKIVATNPRLRPAGIDRDPRRIERARTRHPRFADAFWTGDLLDDERPWVPERRYALALVMPGRLLETPAARAAWLRERLHACCDRLLVYGYGDWLARHGDLRELSARAGFEVDGWHPGAPVALARIA
jgi:SAM-dependent methyltransferase